MQPPAETDTLRLQRIVRAAQADAARWRTEASSSSDASAGPWMGSGRDAAAIGSLLGCSQLHEIRRGSQGVVYEAIQNSTGHRVALKLMRRWESDAGRRRFAREAQLLTELRHPNLVEVHAAGEADDCLYLLMELVRGAPIDQFDLGDNRTLDDVLRLFVTACDGVNAAHRKGVIHRDLKPEHILVDGIGVARVLDFGLAKSTQQLDETTLTQPGQFVGTVAWASPEQARADAARVDTGTDVYALGLILYRLLTGRLPYDVSGSTRDVLNRIVECDPTPPRSLRREIDRDVETIVLKCLAKVPEARYQTAGDLASDIRRRLAGEAIEARRGSALYVLGRSLRKHRAAATVAAAVLATATAGSLLALTQWRRAELARRSESEQRTRAEAISSFLKEVLTAADPAKARGENLTMREALNAAARRIDDGALEHQPLVEAEIRSTIGSTYHRLGLYSQAAAQLRAADALFTSHLGAEHPATLRARCKLAEAMSWMTDYSGAVPLAESTLAAQRRTLGVDHPDTQQTMLILGQLLPWADVSRFAEAEAMLQTVLEHRKQTLGPAHIETARAMHLLGEAYTMGAYREKAEPLHREALRIHTSVLGPDDPETLETEYSLACELVQARRSTEAEPILRRLLETRRRIQGPDHLGTLGAMEMLGAALKEQRRYPEAEPFLRQKLDALPRAVGPDHQDHVSTRLNLAECLEGQGRHAEAESVLREALDVSLRCYGPEHAGTTIWVMNALVGSLELQHKDGDAEQVARQVIDIQRHQKSRPLVWQFSESMRALIGILKRRGMLDEALSLEQELIAFVLHGARAPGASPKDLHEAARHLLNSEFPALRDPPRALELAMEANRRTDFRNPVFLNTLAQAHVRSGDSSRAKEVWELLFARPMDGPARSAKLNAAAWWLLSLAPDEPRDSRLALEFAQRANELTGNAHPAYLDTLALAHHQTGDTARAIELERKALSVVSADAPERAQYQQRLLEFESGVSP